MPVRFLQDLSKEIIGTIIFVIVIIFFIMILIILGQSTGQTDLSNKIILGFVIVFIIGMPIGLISFLKRIK